MFLCLNLEIVQSHKQQSQSHISFILGIEGLRLVYLSG